MKKTFLFLLVICFSLGLLQYGCMVKKEESSSVAIEKSQTLTSVQEKSSYLIGQAKAFYNAKEYQQAIDTAKYILSNIDENSMQAKDIIEKAKKELEALVKSKAEEMKNILK